MRGGWHKVLVRPSSEPEAPSTACPCRARQQLHRSGATVPTGSIRLDRQGRQRGLGLPLGWPSSRVNMALEGVKQIDHIMDRG
jgi:hypothetical protein